MSSSDEFLRYFLSQIGYHVPMIVVCLVGMTLSLVYWSRRPRKCLLVMLASVISLVLNVSYAVSFAYVLSRHDSGWARQNVLSVMGWVTSIVTTIPHGLLFIAALSGNPGEQRAFPVQMAPPLMRRL